MELPPIRARTAARIRGVKVSPFWQIGWEATVSLEETYRDYRESPRRRRAWAADNRGNRAIRAELLERIVGVAGERLGGQGEILDVGCGGGWLLAELTARGVEERRLHGVDLLESRVEAAGRRLPAADVRLADARRLPYPDERFHLVTLLTCLSSMPDHDAVREALAEAGRVLSGGGLLLCYEPRLPNPFNRATLRVSLRLMKSVLGPHGATYSLTGFPPLARRLGTLTPRLYPPLSRVAPTHALTCWSTPGP